VNLGFIFDLKLKEKGTGKFLELQKKNVAELFAIMVEIIWTKKPVT
jgi:hypothetical protein